MESFNPERPVGFLIDTQTDAKKSKAQKDIQQLFGSTDETIIKRQREQYAIDLRKHKRDEHFKAKRANLASNELDISVEMQQSPGPLVDIGVAKAMSFIDSVTPQQFITDVCKMLFKISDFPQLVQLFNTTRDLQILFATIGMRRLLSLSKDPPFQQFIDSNLTPKFIKYCTRFDLPKLQHEAAWCLTNVASGTGTQTLLISEGMLEAFVQLLASPHMIVVEQAIWGLGNLAGDGAKIRDFVIDAGAVNPISDLCDMAERGSSFVRNASWCLSNMCRSKPPVEFQKIKRVIPTLAKVIIENDSVEIISDICWAISYLSDVSGEAIQCLISANLLPRMIGLMQHEILGIAVSSLRAVGNVLTQEDAISQLAIDHGAINALRKLSKHPKITIRKEVCWAISNITAGNMQQNKMILDSGLYDYLVESLIKEEPEVRKEALWAVSNSTVNSSPEQFQAFVEKGALNGLCAIMHSVDAKMQVVALEGIGNILTAGARYYRNQEGHNVFCIELERQGGVDLLEELQEHQNQAVYELAKDLLEKHFSSVIVMDGVGGCDYAFDI